MAPRPIQEVQSVDEINAVLSFGTQWFVTEAISPRQVRFLRVFAMDAMGGRDFLTAVPRDTPADVIHAFAQVCMRYEGRGVGAREPQRPPARLAAAVLEGEAA